MLLPNNDNNNQSLVRREVQTCCYELMMTDAKDYSCYTTNKCQLTKILLNIYTQSFYSFTSYNLVVKFKQFGTLKHYVANPWI